MSSSRSDNKSSQQASASPSAPITTSTQLSTIFHPSHPNQKILISRGKGFGWITAVKRPSTPEFLAWMLTYKPLVDFIDDYRKWPNEFTDSSSDDNDDEDTRRKKKEVLAERERLREFRDTIEIDILRDMQREAVERFGTKIPVGGFFALRVVVVDGPFVVKENEGDESVEELRGQEHVRLP